MRPSVEIRESARAILLNADGRALLFQFSFPGITEPGRTEERLLWTTPGGGVEPGENDRAALVREVKEETGIEIENIGPLVGIRNVVFVRHGVPFLSRERFCVIRLNSNPEIRQDFFDQIEHDTFHGFRWFSVEELHAERANISPPRMAEYVQGILEGRAAGEVVEME